MAEGGRLRVIPELDPFDPKNGYNPVTGKENGIFYITGTLDINNSGLVVGDGVT